MVLSLWCVGRIDSIVSDSRYGFVFEFVEWTIFRVGIGQNFVFFGSLSKCEFGSVGRVFYAICGDFERNLFAHYFQLVM